MKGFLNHEKNQEAYLRDCCFSNISFSNRTDQFMWIVNGMLGAVLAFVLFAGSGLSATMHVELFGTYLLINGLTDLFFGVHSYDEKLALKEERAAKRLAAKKGKK